MSIERASANSIAQHGAVRTGSGLQAMSSVTKRRMAIGLVVVSTIFLLSVWFGSIVFAGGVTLIGVLLLLLFLLEAPWTALGFWNALLGFALIKGSRGPTEGALSPAAFLDNNQPLSARTAILMTLRNEDPTRAFLRLMTIKASLDATGQGEKFDYFILSDSSRPDVIAAEEAAVEAWRRQVPEAGRIMYRRRENNVGFKAGNVYDFCRRWGLAYDFMLPLDADSLMTGETVVRLVRVMQANPRIGILQTLIAGMPSRSLFARLFQFGMRHGMRSYSAGSNWWQADCGPFWGHNALIRIAPFVEHCRLPELDGEPPLGGPILSHDQVEGVFMRRGGYEVRLLPEETGSYEENPPTLAEFLCRNARWCRGNLQYLKLWNTPGLYPASRFHLALALVLFFSQASMVAFVALAAFAAVTWPADMEFPVASALALYLTWMGMYFAPKLLGMADAFLRSAWQYGGRLRLLLSGTLEIVFTFLLVPVVAVASTLSMTGIMFGRTSGWDGQQRDGYTLSWKQAAAMLWPQTAFGLGVLAVLAIGAPGAIVWFLPFLAGLILAVPLAVITSSSTLGALATHWKLCAVPEEIAMPAEIAAIQRPMRSR